MPIFSVKNEKNAKRIITDRRIVGVEIPQHYYNILTLAALTSGVTRTTILRDIIERWATIQSEKAVIDDFVKKIHDEWLVQKRLNPREDIGNYMVELEAWLDQRGIDEQTITIISKAFLDAER